MGVDEPVGSVIEFVGVVEADVVPTIEGMVESPPKRVRSVVIASGDDRLILITEAIAAVAIDLPTAVQRTIAEGLSEGPRLLSSCRSDVHRAVTLRDIDRIGILMGVA